MSAPLNVSVDIQDIARLTAKQEQVLARLRRGPATNRELNELCFSYRQRSADEVRADLLPAGPVRADAGDGGEGDEAGGVDVRQLGLWGGR